MCLVLNTVERAFRSPKDGYLEQHRQYINAADAARIIAGRFAELKHSTEGIDFFVLLNRYNARPESIIAEMLTKLYKANILVKGRERSNYIRKVRRALENELESLHIAERKWREVYEH